MAEEVADATELDAVALNPFAPAKSTATLAFELKKPAVTLPTGHPFWMQRLLMEGGDVALQVYHLLPIGPS